MLCLSFYLEGFYNSSCFFSIVYFVDSIMQKLYKVVKFSPINHFLLVEAVTKTAKYNIFLISKSAEILQLRSFSTCSFLHKSEF